MSDKHSNCPKETIVHQLAKVQAKVAVKPLIKHKKPKVYCIESSIRPNCDCEENRRCHSQNKWEAERSSSRCTFTLTQILCVEIPIEVGVDVDVDKGIIRCSKPDFGPCESRHKELYETNQNDEPDSSDAE